MLTRTHRAERAAAARRTARRCVLAALLFLAPPGLAGAAASCEADPTGPRPGSTPVPGTEAAAGRATRWLPDLPLAPSPATIDGDLDDELWSTALSVPIAYEVNPGENVCTEVRTEALLAYDDSHLYVAFRAHDPEPGRVRARLSDRDRAFQDDFVGVVLDTFNDERRAFEFFVNPLGVQMDLVQDDVAGNEDSSWDAIWKSAGRLTDSGYQVEMAIPYTSLRFQRGTGPQTWGLDLIRIYPRDKRYLLSLNPRDRNVSCYLCQIAKVSGFDGASPGRNLEISPTVTALRTDALDSFPDGRLQKGDADGELGLTTRWGITPNLTLSGALNPDFSQVEADVARLDVNEQFALFFPEKRPFFLEGADFFETPIPVVHTRTVADPRWGVKISGKEGKGALGAFLAEDDLTSLLFPGSQGSSFGSLDDRSTTGVVRYRRDVGGNSALGAVASLRDGGGYDNQVLGFDALLRPADADTIRVQVLGSRTEYPAQTAADFGQPQGSFSDRALFASYRHSPRNWTARVNYLDLGRDFRSDLGFLPQVDIRQPIIGAAYRWWGDPEDWYTRIEVGGDWDLTEDQDGNLIERELEAWVTLGGPMQSFVLLGGGHRTRDFRAGSFPQDFVNFYGEFQPLGDLYLFLEAGVSQRVDFAFFDPGDPTAARQGDELRLGPGLRYSLGRHLRFDLRHEFRRLDLGSAGTLFEANLSELRLVYQLNVRSFFRAIVQHADVERGTGLYPACVSDPSTCGLEPENRDLFTQLLFSYKLNPQTALFVGYTDSRAALLDTSLIETERTFFFKIGYAWVL